MPGTEQEKVALLKQALRPFAMAYGHLAYYGAVEDSDALCTEEGFELHSEATEFGAAEGKILLVDDLRIASEFYAQANGGVPAHAE